MSQVVEMIKHGQMGGGLQYWQKVINLLGKSSIVAYWPLSESSGPVATDIVNARNGAHFNDTLANAISPAGRNAPLFSAGDVNAYTAALNTNWPKQEGAICGFAKASDAGVWTDGQTRYTHLVSVDSNNRDYIRRQATNYEVAFSHTAGGTNRFGTLYANPTGWFHWMISWSTTNSRVICRFNGAPFATLAAPGSWTGALSASFVRIGSFSGAANFLSGWESDVLVINREPTDAEAIALTTASIRPIRLSVLGDSISLNQANPFHWQDDLVNLYNSGWLGIVNHAVSGHTIAENLAGQVTAAANDNADLIIIHMGTNDDNAGNMITLQNTYATAISDLKASNPRARVFGMNVLPKWTNNTGATSVDKGNIRTAIAAACAAQGITCWDTFSTPWITAAQTSDGTHPTIAGHAAIAAQVVARLP